MIASFHNHSQWSDGQNTIAELCAASERQKLGLLGFSDHLCVFPDRTSPAWSLAPARVHEYIAEIERNRDAAKAELIVGLEFDWFADHGLVLRPIMESLDLDFRIGAVHHVEGRQFDVSREFWESRSSEARDEVFIGYWKLIAEMAGSGLFDIAAHIDLPKKLGYFPSQAVSPHVVSALDSIESNGLVVELNTAGYATPCGEAYPSPDILTMCRDREIPVTISADAHRSEDLTREFNRGLSLLHQLGFRQIARFRHRAVWFESLDSARLD